MSTTESAQETIHTCHYYYDVQVSLQYNGPLNCICQMNPFLPAHLLMCELFVIFHLSYDYHDLIDPQPGLIQLLLVNITIVQL